MDNDNDSQLEEKQQYLRKSILEKGYDCDKFLNYLIQIKGDNGNNLINWTMLELIQTVKSFTEEQGIIPSNDDTEDIDSHPSNHNYTHSNSLFDDTASNNNNITSSFKQDPNQTQTQGDVDVNGQQDLSIKHKHRRQSNTDYEFNEILKCENIEQTTLSKFDNITITIVKSEKHQGGIFSKSYLSFEIVTSPINLNVSRRYSDFKWLREIMSIVYIGSIIPPLPKKLNIEKWNQSSISKSMRAYEKFLQGLIDDSLIKHSPILYDFLFIQKESEFYSRKTYYNKVKSPKNLSNIISINGKIKLHLSAKAEDYIDSIKRHNDVADCQLKKLTTSLSSLTKLMSSISEKMKEVSDICLHLYENSRKIEDNQSISDIYRVLSALMSHWSESEKKQSNMINIHLRENFRFLRKECNSLKEQNVKLEEKQMIYYKFNDKLMAKKEELFRKGDISKWGLSSEDAKDKEYLMNNKSYALNKMLPKESAVSYMNKRFYAYYINQHINEFERIRMNDGNRHKDSLVFLSKSFRELLNQLNGMWKEMLDFFNTKQVNETNSDN